MHWSGPGVLVVGGRAWRYAAARARRRGRALLLELRFAASSGDGLSARLACDRAVAARGVLEIAGRRLRLMRAVGPGVDGVLRVLVRRGT